MAENKDDDVIEQLISHVSTHDAIYNKRNKDHMRTQCVEGAWTEISSALNKDVQWCIDKWKNLQRNYRNFLNKENLPSGSGAHSRGRPKFPFAQQMSFLLEHIQPKVTKSNFRKKEQSPESLHGNDSSDIYVGGTESSKSFRGLTQSELDDLEEQNTVKMYYDGFLRDTLNLSPPKVPEQRPHCSYNPPHTSPPHEKEHSSSEDDEDAPKKSKLASDDLNHQNHEPIDYVAGDSGNEGSGSRQTLKTGSSNRRRDQNKKTKKHPKRQPRRRDVESSPERPDLEDGFYLRMTEAARSITNRFQMQPKEKEKPSDEDAIINHFCKMQKHMLRTINADARLEYMKQCKNKLFDLCAIDKDII